MIQRLAKWSFLSLKKTLNPITFNAWRKGKHSSARCGPTSSPSSSFSCKTTPFFLLPFVPPHSGLLPSSSSSGWGRGSHERASSVGPPFPLRCIHRSSAIAGRLIHHTMSNHWHLHFHRLAGERLNKIPLAWERMQMRRTYNPLHSSSITFYISWGNPNLLNKLAACWRISSWEAFC